MKKVNYFKVGLTVLMAVYGFVCAQSPSDFHFLDRVNLIAHEAGHLLFLWFGEFTHIIGGTMGQLFVPAAFTTYFYFRREMFSSVVTFFWFGVNFINISVYVKDAQAMELPLVSIGGGDAIHDWNYILAKLALMRWDHAIGAGVYGIGVVIMIVAIMGYFYYSIDREEPNL